MKSLPRGKGISGVEIEGISKNGIWIFITEREYFLPFSEYPWFKNGKLSEIYNVSLLHGTHLYWPDLDVDLELASLQNPEQYPLIYR